MKSASQLINVHRTSHGIRDCILSHLINSQAVLSNKKSVLLAPIHLYDNFSNA